MDKIDTDLAQWALGEAKRHGATAAGGLCVSAGSVSAGGRLGGGGKAKGARGRRLGPPLRRDASWARARYLGMGRGLP